MKLSDKFTKQEIEWRVQRSGNSNGKTWAMVLPYITSRAIMDRLDAVIGHLNWKVSHTQMNKGITCVISIWDEEKKQWIDKEDGAPETDIESFKGGMSDSLKRAAVLWGMGRYLYAMKGPFFVELKADKSGEYQAKIKDDPKYYTWNAPDIPEMYL